jgi:uncharacterized protein
MVKEALPFSNSAGENRAMNDASGRLDLLLPVGTSVIAQAETRDATGRVRPAGAVAVIVASPTDHRHAYRVRFPDGGEASLTRGELLIRRHAQRAGLAPPPAALADRDLSDCVIYRCVVGSRAYGLEREQSDIDRRGIYLPPADLHWSLFGVPEQLENAERQECYWELQKFLLLALKANPTALECLYTPLIETATPLAEELLAMRDVFISRLAYQTYNGYVMSQFQKLERDIRAHGTLKRKHALHLIRLLLSGIGVLRDGAVTVRVERHRDRLLAIRDGEMSWGALTAWRLELHQEFDDAFQKTTIPARPDYAQANAFLVRARRAMAERAERKGD